MKKINKIAVLIALVAMAKLPTSTYAKSFSDVEDGNWAKAYIDSYTDKSIVNGYEDGTFKPEKFVTREEFAKVVVNAFEYQIDAKSAGFTDVDENAWYAPYVNTLANLSIINGIGSNEFGVGKPITRQDICTILYRVLENKSFELNLNEGKQLSFKDVGQIDDYAFNAVKELYQAGVVNGISENEFMPKEYTTRAQMVKMVYLATSEDIRKEEENKEEENKQEEKEQEQKEQEVTKTTYSRNVYGLVTTHKISKGTNILTIDGKDYKVNENQEVSEEIVGTLICFDEKASGIKIKKMFTANGILEKAKEVEKIEDVLVKLQDEDEKLDLEVLEKDYRGRIFSLEITENSEGEKVISDLEEFESFAKLKINKKDKILLIPIDSERIKDYDEFLLIKE